MLISNNRITGYDSDGIRVIRFTGSYENKMSFVRRVLVFGRFVKPAEKYLKSLFDNEKANASAQLDPAWFPGLFTMSPAFLWNFVWS